MRSLVRFGRKKMWSPEWPFSAAGSWEKNHLCEQKIRNCLLNTLSASEERSVFRKPLPEETVHFLGGLYWRFGCYVFDLMRCERVEVLNLHGRAESVSIQNPIHRPWLGPKAVSYHLTRLLLTGVSPGPQLTGNESLATPDGYGICRKSNISCRSISFSCPSFKKMNF